MGYDVTMSPSPSFCFNSTKMKIAVKLVNRIEDILEVYSFSRLSNTDQAWTKGVFSSFVN